MMLMNNHFICVTKNVLCENMKKSPPSLQEYIEERLDDSFEIMFPGISANIRNSDDAWDLSHLDI